MSVSLMQGSRCAQSIHVFVNTYPVSPCCVSEYSVLMFSPPASSRLAMGAVGSNSCSPRISSQGVRLTRRIYQLTCPTSSPSRRSYLQAWLSPARTGLSDASLADFIGSSSRSVRGRTSPVWLCDASHHAILDPLPITFDALISR